MLKLKNQHKNSHAASPVSGYPTVAGTHPQVVFSVPTPALHLPSHLQLQDHKVSVPNNNKHTLPRTVYTFQGCTMCWSLSIKCQFHGYNLYKLTNLNSREKSKPGSGFEPRFSRSLA